MDSAGKSSVSPRRLLENLASDAKAGAQARASAARTLAEMDGFLGRHQTRPDRTADLPVEELSRTELMAELARLRSRVLS